MFAGAPGGRTGRTENPRVGSFVPLLPAFTAGVRFTSVRLAGGGHRRDRLLPDDRPRGSPSTSGKQSGKASAKTACLLRLIASCGFLVRASGPTVLAAQGRRAGTNDGQLGMILVVKGGHPGDDGERAPICMGTSRGLENQESACRQLAFWVTRLKGTLPLAGYARADVSVGW